MSRSEEGTSSPSSGPPKRRTKRPSNGVVIEPVGADLVALAQAHALDVTVFPHQSLPPVFGPEAPPAVWVARLGPGSAVVGFIATRAIGAALAIPGLAVAPEHRRAGLARALLRVAVRAARARGFDTVELHVSTANEAALALYKSERFRKASRVPGFYPSPRFPDGGAAWLMVKDLY